MLQALIPILSELLVAMHCSPSTTMRSFANAELAVISGALKSLTWRRERERDMYLASPLQSRSGLVPGTQILRAGADDRDK